MMAFAAGLETRAVPSLHDKVNPMWIVWSSASFRAHALCNLAVMKQLVAALVVAQLAAGDDIFKDRPAFSWGDQPAESSAECQNVRRMSAGLPKTDQRIDLSITGELTMVRTGGALWYLLMCQDLRVLCVTYEQNGKKAGDRVTFKGGYNRLDDNHVMLDPYLASAP